jgi:DNA-binding NtrC family response regulator
MSNVLAVDDDLSILRALERILRREGHVVTTADSGEAALATVGSARPDVILLDVEMGGIDGLETLTRLGQQAPSVPVIIMTAKNDVDTAVHAFKRGAFDFVVKPFVEAKLLAALRAATAQRREPTADGAPTLVGESPRFREVMDLAVRLAKPDINILLEGETGTGKELFARAIHAASGRRKGPFIAVDCSMLAENLIESELFGHEKGAFTGAIATRIGHFERADGGTLFLDEVGNLSLHVQAKLLRTLQERTIERVGGRELLRLDVRVVSAANVDLREAAKRGAFRTDLYYRLAEATICPPPLRERVGDVRRLAAFFVERYASRFGVSVRGVSPEALARLEAHAWPGNVRELEAVIKVAVVLAQDVVQPEQLPKWIALPERREEGWLAPAPPADAALAAQPTPSADPRRLRVELELSLDGEAMDLKALTAEAADQAERAILSAMVRRGHSQARLAKILDVDPKTLRGKLRKYGLETTSE